MLKNSVYTLQTLYKIFNTSDTKTKKQNDPRPLSEPPPIQQRQACAEMHLQNDEVTSVTSFKSQSMPWRAT